MNDVHVLSEIVAGYIFISFSLNNITISITQWGSPVYNVTPHNSSVEQLVQLEMVSLQRFVEKCRYSWKCRRKRKGVFSTWYFGERHQKKWKNKTLELKIVSHAIRGYQAPTVIVYINI